MALSVVYLVRHGKAESQASGGDRFRALSAEGRRRIAVMVPEAKERGMAAGLALSSPYLRAIQTRDLFLPILGFPQSENSDAFTPEADVGDAFEELRSWEDRGTRAAAVFTHNPFVTALADLLLVPGSWPEPVFHTPSVLAVGFGSGIQVGQGRLLWVLHP